MFIKEMPFVNTKSGRKAQARSKRGRVAHCRKKQKKAFFQDVDDVWVDYKSVFRKNCDRGLEAELLVTELANWHKRRETIFADGVKIVRAIHCRGGSTGLKYLDNEEGIDVLILFNSGLALALQVKLAIGRKIQSHLKKHPYIVHVFGVGELPQEPWDNIYVDVFKRLKNIIMQALQAHRKMICV